MKTKQQQKDEALKAYLAIRKPAWESYQAIQEPAHEAYLAKLKEIDEQEEEETIIEVKGKRYKLIEDTLTTKQ